MELFKDILVVIGTGCLVCSGVVGVVMFLGMYYFIMNQVGE